MSCLVYNINVSGIAMGSDLGHVIVGLLIHIGFVVAISYLGLMLKTCSCSFIYLFIYLRGND